MSRYLQRCGRQGLLCATACCAMAFEAPQVGLQALGSWPTGALRQELTSNTGYGLGAFAGWEVGPGRALRLAYDGVWYQHKDQSKPRSHCVSAQYLVYPSGDTEGLYFKVGLGAMNYLRVETTASSPATLVANGTATVSRTVLDETGTKLATLAGLGFDFGKNWGVLAQYSFITSNNHTLGAVQTGISYRF